MPRAGGARVDRRRRGAVVTACAPYAVRCDILYPTHVEPFAGAIFFATSGLTNFVTMGRSTLRSRNCIMLSPIDRRSSAIVTSV
jgi:hypothetical protein